MAVGKVSCHTSVQTLPKFAETWLAGLEEALIDSLADAEGVVGRNGAPPASKHAVKSLVREHLSEQRLQQLGGSGTECAVCRCTYFRHNKGSACMLMSCKLPCQSGQAGWLWLICKARSPG